MTDNELLLAMSDMMDKKLEPLKKDIVQVREEIVQVKEDQSRMHETQTRMYNEISRINIILENEIRGDIRLLAENYLPAAKKYEKTVTEIDSIKSDVDVLKKVVTEHSDKFQKLA